MLKVETPAGPAHGHCFALEISPIASILSCLSRSDSPFLFQTQFTLFSGTIASPVDGES
jgi:hypothetical protein